MSKLNNWRIFDSWAFDIHAPDEHNANKQDQVNKHENEDIDGDRKLKVVNQVEIAHCFIYDV